MKTRFLLLCFLSLTLMSAQGASTITLRCPGRPVMTLIQSDSGLVTEQWRGQFEVAQGYETAVLTNGDPVRLSRFQNGDQWFLDLRNNRHFFSYAGQNKLRPCNSGDWTQLKTSTPSLLLDK